MLPERQGFREKYRSAARMIFSETACGLTLPSDKKRLPTLPCSSRSANGCICLSFLSVPDPVILVFIKYGIPKEPSVGTALSCKVLQWFICRICFISRYCIPVESEYQAAEDAEKYRRRYQKAGDFIEEPEESPETDDGDCRPYR